MLYCYFKTLNHYTVLVPHQFLKGHWMADPFPLMRLKPVPSLASSKRLNKTFLRMSHSKSQHLHHKTLMSITILTGSTGTLLHVFYDIVPVSRVALSGKTKRNTK